MTEAFEARVDQCIRSVIGDDIDLSAGVNLLLDLDLDELDKIEIIMAIEDDFEIELPDETFEAAQTIDQLYAYVYRFANS